MPSVLNDWVADLTFMQQSVLLAMIRNADMIDKHHPQKEVIKWFRRCIVRSAFDARTLTDPTEEGGGSFTGPVADVWAAMDQFVWARDGMTLHYYAHAMHAFEILGYKHPDPWIRDFWYQGYMRLVNGLHMNPETEREMDRRLCDNIDTWKEREDCLGGCTRTEPLSNPVYQIGDLTMANVFTPNGITNVHDLQAVFDATEAAFASFIPVGVTPLPQGQDIFTEVAAVYAAEEERGLRLGYPIQRNADDMGTP